MKLIVLTTLFCLAASQGASADDDDRTISVRHLIYELQGCYAWAECGGTLLDLKHEDGTWSVIVLAGEHSPEDLAAAYEIKSEADRFIAKYRPILDGADRETVRSSVPLGFRESSEAFATREALQRRRITAKYQDYELADLLTSLTRLSGVAIDADWRSLPMKPAAWVSVKADDDPLEHVLKGLASELDDGRCSIAFAVDGSRVVLTTDAARRKLTSIAAYEVHDLLELELRALPPDSNGRRPAATLDIDIVTRHLIDLIVDFVDTRGWAMMGGTTGVLYPLDGWLFVLNTAETHRAIERLFAAMRAAARDGHASVGPSDDLTCSLTAPNLRIYDLVDLIHARLPRPTAETLGEWNGAKEGLVWEVLDLIVEEVDTEGWDMRGGTESIVRESAGMLFVSTTEKNHREIERLLAAVRASR